MENSNKYNRSFLIFSQEDVGFGFGREPAGHIKIEVKEGQGKLYSQIHNLNINLKNIIYKLYLVRCEKSELDFLKVGSFDIKGVKTEICWNFNPKNVGSSGIEIDRYNVFVVAAADVDGIKTPAFPLVAYRGNKTKWKERFIKAIYEPKDDCIIEEAQRDESKMILTNETEYYCNPQEELEKLDYPKQQDDFKQENYKDSKEYQENESNNESREYQENESNAESEEDQESSQNRACFNIQDSLEEPIKHNCSKCLADCWARNYSDINYEINAPSHTNNNEQIEFNRLKDILAKFYERIYPFGGSNKYYQWWRIKNPATLNNIFHQCNIKNPVFYNPKLQMSYYKYRHLILGICNDESTSKEYIVIGIPSIYGLDEIPMRVFCRWAQTEGGVTRYGAFGYWLLYIDTKFGKIIY